MLKIETNRDEEVGNTKSHNDSATSDCSKNGVKRQGKQMKKWCFTLNNYAKQDLESIVPVLTSLCCKFVFQEETGETGTKHLQGVCWFKKKKRMTELKKIEYLSKAHWESCRSWEHSVDYCRKSESRTGKVFCLGVNRPRAIVKTLSNEQLYEWQKEILTIIEKDPDDRTIYWYYETKGNVGKSTFCKYLAIKHAAIILSGKATDMKYGIIKFIEKHGDYPQLIVFDVPRTTRQFLSYQGIEEVKNGCFFSSKYESDMVIGNAPHLFIFANFKPDIEKMSMDRWRIRCLGEEMLSDDSMSDFCA